MLLMPPSPAAYRRPRRAAAWIALAATAAFAAAASAARVEVTYTERAALDHSTGYGFSPGLATGADGNLYGLANYGGAQDCGTLYRVAPEDGTVTKLHDFNYPETGCYLGARLTPMPDGSLWGVGESGGVDGAGTVFRFDPATGGMTIVHTFHEDGKGNLPDGRLLLASDGMIYGTTVSSDVGSTLHFDGTIFRIDPANSAYELLHTFTRDRGEIGGFVGIGLVEGNDGRLYGATSYDATLQGPGALFAFDRATNKVHLLHKFTGSGERPAGELTLGPEGTLYGATYGDLDSKDGGEVFSIRANGNFEVLHVFDDGHGAHPRGGLTLDAQGWLCGNTERRNLNPRGSQQGTSYRLRPNGGNFSMLIVYGDDKIHGEFERRGDDLWNVTGSWSASATAIDNVFTLTTQPR